MDELQNHRVNSCSQNKLADQTTIVSSDCLPDDDENEGADDVSTSHEPTEATKVLAGLIVEAPIPEVRDCLRQYSENKSYKKQSIAFNVYGKQVIIQTLIFLGATDKNWDDHIKSACIHELIYRIQGLLPEVCAICNDTYTIHKDDSPLLACSICKQEVHRECYTPLLNGNQNIADLPGFHYFCPSCEKDLIPEKDTGLKKGKKKESASTNISIGDLDKCTEKYPNRKQSVSKSTVNNSSDKLESYSHTKPTPKPPLRPTVKVIDVNDHKQYKQDGKKENHLEESEVQSCKHYKNNKCKYGISGKGCKYVHPKRCTKLMNHGTRANNGCKLGTKCKDFHPKMCPMSISKSECFDASCQLCHVKGTKRKPPAPKDKECEKKEPVIETHNNSNLPASDLQQSFLVQMNLLKKELQEVMDMKVAALLNPRQQNVPIIPSQAQSQQTMLPKWLPPIHPMWQQYHQQPHPYPAPQLFQPYQSTYQSPMFQPYQIPMSQM